MYDTIRVSSDADVIEAGRNRIRELALTPQKMTIQNEQVVGNERGGYFMNLLLEMKEEISGLEIHTLKSQNTDLLTRAAELKARNADLDARIADLDARNADLDARVSRLESQNKSLLAFQNLFFSVRERAFATFLRDYCREYGAKGHSQPWSARSKLGSEIRSRISQLNRSILHGGLAEIDALMFQERRPVEELPDFEHLYGLGPSAIIEIGKSHYPSAILYY